MFDMNQLTIPGIGVMDIYISPNLPEHNPRSNAFFIGDHYVLKDDGRCAPRYYPSPYNKVYQNLLEAVKAHLPEQMLQDKKGLYIIAQGKILKAKSKRFLPNTLEDFVQDVERKQMNARVMGFSSVDFEEFFSIIEKRGRWGIEESAIDRVLYRFITYTGKLAMPALQENKLN